MGLGIVIDGSSYASPQTATWTVGTAHTLATATPQFLPGIQYNFSGWSDGGAISHQVTAALATTSYTATFNPQYLLTVAAGTGGTVTAMTGAYYDPGSQQSIVATPSAGYYFTGWTGSSGIASPASASTSVTMNAPENIVANFAPIPGLVVTSLMDDAPGAASNCPGSNCTLRDAILAADANNNGAGNITFASGLSGVITLRNPLPALNGLITVSGPATSFITVYGNNSPAVGSIFTVSSGAAAAISNLTITNGNASNGGGINNSGTLTVSGCTLIGNAAANQGGAIANASGPLTVNYSTFFANNTPGSGGAIANAGTLSVSNSTFSNNIAGNQGGAIANQSTASVTNSILTGNSALQGAGLFNSATANANNNVYYNNFDNPGSSEDDCNTCTANASPIAGNANLSVLANYGGPTLTMLPLPGSAAICTASAALLPVGYTTDQRGLPNWTSYQGTTCYDVGAVQSSYSLDFNVQQPVNVPATVAMSPAPIVTVRESGNPVITAPISVRVVDSASDLIGAPVIVSTSNGQATFSALAFNTATSNDALTATLALNSAINTTAASNSFNVIQTAPLLVFVPAPASQIYGTPIAAGSLAATAIANGNPVPGSFTYSTTVLGIPTPLNAGSTILPAGSYIITASFTPSNAAEFTSGSVTASYNVTKANPIVTFTGAPNSSGFGTKFNVTATTSDPGNVPSITASGACSISGNTVTMTSGSGTCSLTASWAADSNYNSATLTQSTNASKIAPTVSFTGAPSSAAYKSTFTVASTTNASTTAAITASGACSISGNTVTMTSGSGTCSLTASWAADSNYNSATLNQSTNASKIAPTVSFTGAPSSAAYKSTFTVASTTNASTTAAITASGACSITGNTVTMTSGSGACSLTAAWAADSNYNSATLTQSTNASKITPTVSWATPAAITYGTALSATQLDAAASVPGTFAYTPASGILTAGTHTLSVLFTPTDSADYTTASATVSLLVNKATPVLTWKPASIQLGYTLGAPQLDATASVAGSFVYTPASGTQVVTTTLTLNAQFTPSDTNDYNPASLSVALTVTPGPLASISPATLNFGNVYLGSITTQIVTVSNIGNKPMTLSEPFFQILQGGDSSEFSALTLCPASLAPGQSCNIDVTFIAGPFYNPQTAVLQIVDGSPASPQSVNVTATVINPQPFFSTLLLNFFLQKAGVSSAAQTVTITNFGTTALVVNGFAFTGANPGDFTQTNTCSAALSPGSSCRVNVVFKPAAAGLRSASMVITDNAQFSPQSIALLGIAY
jgi:CSLREA domain-containing protein